MCKSDIAILLKKKLELDISDTQKLGKIIEDIIQVFVDEGFYLTED